MFSANNTESSKLNTTPVMHELLRQSNNCNSGKANSSGKLVLKRAGLGTAAQRSRTNLKENSSDEQKNLLSPEDKGTSSVKVCWKVGGMSRGEFGLDEFRIAETEINQLDSAKYEMPFISGSNKNSFWN